MVAPYVVVEGVIDEVMVRQVLASRGIVAQHVIVTGGKSRLDERLAAYNQAARQQPWLVLRDADHDGSGCAVTLRHRLLPAEQATALCLRLAVRTAEAWLLADAESFSMFFAVSATNVPRQPEQLDRPKDALVNVCRKSRRKAVRVGMVPPEGTAGVGPEYTAMITEFVSTHWRVEVASQNADSLNRTLREIDRLRSDGSW